MIQLEQVSKSQDNVERPKARYEVPNSFEAVEYNVSKVPPELARKPNAYLSRQRQGQESVATRDYP